MSKQPPQRPMTDRPVPNNWLRDFYDYVRSLELRGDLATTTVSRDRTGTVVRAPFATAGGQGASDAQEPPVIVEITGDNDDGSYNATEVRVDSSSLDNFATPSGDYFTLDTGNNGVLYEINGRSGVAAGTHVIAVLLPDSNTGSVRWYFDATADQYGFGGISGGTSGGDGTVGAWVELTSNTSPYSWKQKDPDASTDTAGVTGAGNLYEVSGRDGIPTGSIAWAWYDGTDYQFEYHGADSGTPEDLMRDESSSTNSQSSEWDRSDQGGARGATVNICTGVRANSATDELYYYFRNFDFDANGHCTDISPETRIVVAVIDAITNSTPCVSIPFSDTYDGTAENSTTVGDANYSQRYDQIDTLGSYTATIASNQLQISLPSGSGNDYYRFRSNNFESLTGDFTITAVIDSMDIWNSIDTDAGASFCTVNMFLSWGASGLLECKYQNETVAGDGVASTKHRPDGGSDDLVETVVGEETSGSLVISRSGSTITLNTLGNSDSVTESDSIGGYWRGQVRADTSSTVTTSVYFGSITMVDGSGDPIMVEC